jgi:HSP20 family protein
VVEAALRTCTAPTSRGYDDSLADLPRLSARGGAPHRWTHKTPDALVPEAELPGLAKDALQVELHGRTLTLRDERKPGIGTSNEHYQRRERAYGNFRRMFTLATSVDAEKDQASFKDGILELEMPKHEPAKPRRIAVQS